MKNLKVTRFFYLPIFLLWTISISQSSHTVTVGPDGSFTFSPKNLSISTGDTVVWIWAASNHSSTSDATSGEDSWDSDVHNSGFTFTHVFNNAGSFPYHCTPHQSFGMIGTINVVTATLIEPFTNKTPHKFNLDQNYPNPFNPTTKITYTIAEAGKVSLKIFNILGKEIYTIVDESQEAKNYAVTFNANNLPSGLYFYTLQSGNLSITKRMVLMR